VEAEAEAMLHFAQMQYKCLYYSTPRVQFASLIYAAGSFCRVAELAIVEVSLWVSERKSMLPSGDMG
jgi:hypothetical protein